MQRAGQLQVLGVLGGYSRQVVGGGTCVEHAGVPVGVRVVWIAVVLKIKPQLHYGLINLHNIVRHVISEKIDVYF